MKRFKRKNGPTFVLPIIAIITAGSRHAIIKTLGNTNGIIGQLTNSLTKCGSMECKLTRWGRLFPEHSIPNRVEPSLVLHYYILCMAKTLCHRELADLSRKNKIVQIHFDEVYTNHATVYSRADDELRGCDYTDQKKKKTREHHSVLVFAASSLLTPFNIVLNGYPRMKAQKNMEWALEENIKTPEELGLDVRADVCDRNGANLAINFQLIDLSSRFIICDTGITATRTSGRVYAKIELFRQHLLRIVLAPAESLVYHGLGW
uniref:Transposable element P transposase-like RNase H domain-containing protein n=1 Tax=Glossina palpalis gambiensis TaxID=67801 RepID=A0A1B0B843_9MUSC